MADPLEGAPAITPPATPPPKAVKISCEFCDCPLAPDGKYLGLSDRAREMRDQSEKLLIMKSELAKANAEISDLTTKLQAATKKEETPKRSFW